MLVGQRVPYVARHEVTETETQEVRKIRAQYRQQAAMGYHAEHALAVVRMPKWEWACDAYRD